MLAMPLLTILPRLTAWGSNQRGRTMEPLVTGNLKQDIFAFERKTDIAIRRSHKQKKPRRRKISYWSDEEAVSIKPSR